MSKRARYDGPHDEVVVQDSQAGIYSEGWVVKRGGWLPDDAPARVRDDLLKSDEWSEIKQARTPKKPQAKKEPETVSRFSTQPATAVPAGQPSAPDVPTESSTKGSDA